MGACRYPVVVVTGSSRGIGKAVALQLAKAGYAVAITYAGNKAAAEETVKECYALAPHKDIPFSAFQLDVGSKESRSTLVDAVYKHFGSIDALVNNAGMAPRIRADITEASEESFEEIIATNLQGPYFLTQAVAKRWLASMEPSKIESGRKVVFVTSVSAQTVSVNRGDYCISKAGLSMAASLWAARLAPDGIQVYEVRPGIVATDMTAKVKEKYDHLIAEGLIPQNRWGSGEDTAKAVEAILGGALAYSTGTIIHTDGGMHIPQL